MLLILIHHQQRILTYLFTPARHLKVIASWDTHRDVSLLDIADDPATAIDPRSYISIQSWALQKLQTSLHWVYSSLHNDRKPRK